MKRERITIYDYDNKPKIIQLPDKDIRLIHVTILSGDETGYVQFDDNTIFDFDASDCRIQSYYDGSYTVTENDMLERWLDWDPQGKKHLSYSRNEDMWRIMENDQST